MNKFKYWGYGLKIASQIEFPELLPANFTTPDVTIEVVDELKEIEGKKNTIGDRSYTINQKELLFEQKHIARYLASGGNRVLMQPVPGTNEIAMVRLVLLTSVLAAILLQKRRLPIHASAILKDGKLTLIAGDSGTGKSTSLAGLINNGHTLFSDDVVAVNQDFMTFASYPMMKLWDDTQQKLNSDLFNDKSYLIKSGVKKYGIFFHDSFITECFPISKFIILKKAHAGQLVSIELTGADKFSAIQAQVYRQLFIQDVELRKLCFEVVSYLSNTCTVYEITRPEVCDHNDLIREVESLLLI